MIGKMCLVCIVFTGFLSEGRSADLVVNEPAKRVDPYHRTVKGQVAVLDGRTLWFAHRGIAVRLAHIDSCELPQWSFDPKVKTHTDQTLAPVPCGALAKAWMKRTVGSAAVTCRLIGDSRSNTVIGICHAKGKDLGLEMLRVGWARLITPFPGKSGYFAAQQYAVAARYGMWATYVLDMAEWRRKAMDRTLGRRPTADLNLLAERGREISPPFADVRRQSSRRDR